MIQFNVSLLFTIINLIVFYLLLKKFLFKPVMGIMEKREKMIADGLKNARKTIENERKQTMNDLQSEIAGLAMQAARKIVDDTKGNQDIYDQFLKGAGDAHVNEEVK